MNKKECCRCCCEPKLSFDGLSSQVINDTPETEEHTAVFYGFLKQTRYALHCPDYACKNVSAERTLGYTDVCEDHKVLSDWYLIQEAQQVAGPVKSVGEQVFLEGIEHPVGIIEVLTKTDGTVVYRTDYIKYVEDPNLSTKDQVEYVVDRLKKLAIELYNRELKKKDKELNKLLEEKDKEIDELHDRILELEKNKKKGFWKRG
ncbi:hypothetical protein [Bacillus phage SBSphiJ5]|nr:hypothetical protein [Bacillus phage SBSphiJ5]